LKRIPTIRCNNGGHFRLQYSNKLTHMAKKRIARDNTVTRAFLDAGEYLSLHMEDSIYFAVRNMISRVEIEADR
jgi:hypothetical protein